MLPCLIGQRENSFPALQQPHGGEEREHHIGGTLLQIEGAADSLQAGRVFVQPGEEVQVRNRRGQKVRRIESIAIPIDGGGIGRRQAQEVERAIHKWYLYRDAD